MAVALNSVAVVDNGTTKDPQGWAVEVNMSLRGFAGVPLILTWSMDGEEVPALWNVPNLAYRVVATTPDDAGTALIWVPHLAKPGIYNVNVELSDASTGLVIARGLPLALPNG